MSNSNDKGYSEEGRVTEWLPYHFCGPSCS